MAHYYSAGIVNLVEETITNGQLRGVLGRREVIRAAWAVRIASWWNCGACATVRAAVRATPQLGMASTLCDFDLGRITGSNATIATLSQSCKARRLRWHSLHADNGWRPFPHRRNAAVLSEHRVGAPTAGSFSAFAKSARP